MLLVSASAFRFSAATADFRWTCWFGRCMGSCHGLVSWWYGEGGVLSHTQRRHGCPGWGTNSQQHRRSRGTTTMNRLSQPTRHTVRSVAEGCYSTGPVCFTRLFCSWPCTKLLPRNWLHMAWGHECDHEDTRICSGALQIRRCVQLASCWCRGCWDRLVSCMTMTTPEHHICPRGRCLEGLVRSQGRFGTA